MSSFKTQVLSL